jgi:hypothetical protein
MKYFSPTSENVVQIWRVLYGQDLTYYDGIKKVYDKPTTLLKSYYDNYQTLTSFPEGFGVVQELMTGKKALCINFYKTSTYLGDAIQGQLVCLSKANFKINVEGVDVFLPSIIGFN